MKDPGCGPKAWAVLNGRLWHATSLDGLRGIQRDGFIRPGTRFKSSFVSARGWVSLFDFGPSARDESNQWRNWAPWFGATHGAARSAWLEVDREAGENDIVDAEALRELWNRELDQRARLGSGGPWAGNIFPGVEGGYRGCLPTALVMRTVVMRTDYTVVGDLGAPETIDERTFDLLLKT